MRPHLLRVTAFGAFGGTAEVSFGDLAGSGLFLLHGETGAGKTTLLDAIGFALYGRVPGERNKTRRLRSDHAAAAVRTEVVFETTIGDRHLRITRRPQQDRPKVHGTGLTSEPAKILLAEERGGRWRAVSTRAREADQEIADAMGMSAEQFFQVVLLPQGEFAEFLHADADQRRALLQKLFRTDRFRAVETWLAERRKTTRDQVEKADQALTTLAARIAQVAGAPPPGVSPASPGRSGAAPPVPGDGPVRPGDGPVPPGDGPVPPGDGPVPPGDGPAPPAGWADALAAEAESGRAAAAQAAAAARQALDAARAAEADTRVLAGRQGRRAALLARRAELRAGAPGRDARRREADGARRAAEIAKVFDDAEHAGALLVTLRDAEAGARAAAGPAGLPDTAGAAEFRAAEQQRREHIGQLTALREVAEQADAEDANAAAAAERAAARAGDIDAAREAFADQQARLEDLTGRRDAAQRAATRLPAVQAGAERERAAASDAAQLAEACAGRRDLHSERESAREIANDLAERALLIRRERIDGMVAELAASLVDGTPCPVCGSQDHPDKPELQTRRVTHQEEEQAVAEADAARETVAKLNSELAGLAALAGGFAGRLAAAGVTDPVLGEAGVVSHLEFPPVPAGTAAVPAGQLGLFDDSGATHGPAPVSVGAPAFAPGGGPSGSSLPGGGVPGGGVPAGRAPGAATIARLRHLAAGLAAAADALEAEAGALAAEAGQLSRHDADLGALRTAVAETEKRLSALAEQQQAALAEAAAARDRAAAQRASLLSRLGGAPDLAAALASAAGLADALAAAASATEAAAAAAEAAAQAEAGAARAAAEAGFEDVPAARAARRSPQWRADEDEASRAYEAETASVTAQLADPELDVPLDPAADLAGAQEAVRLAAERHDAAVTALGLARDRAATLAGLAPQFAAERAALEPLRERAEEARRLADLAGGQGANTLKMTLSAFVLAARLEEVAEAASQRLLTMTAGRYSLAHTDARRGGGGRSGLGLLACDSWTGLERDTSTLSGGETFLASLALALGLADVVTAEAAGVPIEALFVDEGFGSLDEDTLEEVMNVLDGLREGGRMVGIVSHVSELRQRIPAQVHVRKGRGGSSVELIRA
jgi:DNA repair protein SbcC/Rad50